MPNTLSALHALLEPHERLDRLMAAAFRRHGPRLIDLSYANPYEGPSEEVRRVLQRVAATCTGLALQYTAIGGRAATRRAIADRLAREYALPFDARDVVLTSGAMTALNLAFRALVGSGDEVLVLTPAWQDYQLYLENLDIPISWVPLRSDKRLDLDAIANAIGPATRGLLFSQPCCPTGVLYSTEEIAALAAILGDAESRFGTAIYAISDEVHRQMVWGEATFYSLLREHPRSVSIYSFGKALALQGQRIGYVAVSPRMPENEEVRRNLERCIRFMGFGNPTSLMQYAVCDLLDATPALQALGAQQSSVRAALTRLGYDVVHADATFYVYVKSPIPDDFEFAERLAARGVLVVPSTLFHDPGYFRLSLTARPDRIAAAMPAFESAMDEVAGRRDLCSNHC